MDKVKSVDITFENCEDYNIPFKYINKMIINGFKKQLYFQNNAGECFETYSCNYIAIKIDVHVESTPWFDFSESFTERLIKYNDITQITLNYEDNSKFNFCVPWESEGCLNNCSNKKQKVLKNKKYIEIVIKE